MKTRHAFELEPVDTFFFRDARPMQAGAGSGGHGANWPFPPVVHEAFRAALLRGIGRLASSKKERGHKGKAIVTRHFESLRTKGPFPALDGVVYLPRPADLIPAGDGKVALMAPLREIRGQTNLPASWLQPVGAPVRPGKETLKQWVAADDFVRFLQASGTVDAPSRACLWEKEHRIGVGIERSTRAAKEGALYSAEHLRPLPGLRVLVEAELAAGAPAREVQELGRLAADMLLLGGESRMCRVNRAGVFSWPEPPAGATRIKWVLATPAVFRGGWRPNWVKEADGRVWLKKGDLERRPAEDRKAWRERVRKLPEIGARLVAVCCDKPQAFSGWDLTVVQKKDDQVKRGAPKATRLAVPAGSVYYFEADPGEEEALVKALHGRTLSDFFGEKGMGLGFCGAWEWMEIPFA